MDTPGDGYANFPHSKVYACALFSWYGILALLKDPAVNHRHGTNGAV